MSTIEIEVDCDSLGHLSYREAWVLEWAKQDPAARREVVLATFKTLVSDVLYYMRREDESLEVGAIEWSVENGDVTVEELIVLFGTELAEHLL